MLPFSIEGLMSADNRTGQVFGSLNQSSADSSTSDRTSSPVTTEDVSFESPSSSSSHTESVAQILLSLEKQSRHLTSASAATKTFPNDKTEKPDHSYIALISMAILSSSSRKLVLADIYQYIMDNFPYYNNNDKAWRNSVRHNLSLNECFVKNGRAENGKGNYWSIHPTCEEDFAKGDYRRRRARRRTRKHSVDRNETVDKALRPYGYGFGYMPMTSSPVGYHPYLGASRGLAWSPTQIPTPQNFYPVSEIYPQSFYNLPHPPTQTLAFSHAPCQQNCLPPLFS